MDKSIDVPERLALKGVSRRDFMKFCGFVATVLGLPMTFAPRIAEAVASKATHSGVVEYGGMHRLHRIPYPHRRSLGRGHHPGYHRPGLS